METNLFTIGHSNHPIDRFVALLKQHGITAVADVRSAPFSRHNPQFNKHALESSLRQEGIAYVFLGKELGARSGDPSCYEKGRVVYKRLANTTLFKSGLERVRKGAETHRVALMCAEKEPLECHRTLLVARALETEGLAVSHIHADGHLETESDAMRRLLKIAGLPETDMFKSLEALIEEACTKQEESIAYIDEQRRRQAAGEVKP